MMDCEGTICREACKSAKMAVQAGWKNVYRIRSGFPESMEAGMPVGLKNK